MRRLSRDLLLELLRICLPPSLQGTSRGLELPFQVLDSLVEFGHSARIACRGHALFVYVLREAYSSAGRPG